MKINQWASILFLPVFYLLLFQVFSEGSKSKVRNKIKNAGHIKTKPAPGSGKLILNHTGHSKEIQTIEIGQMVWMTKNLNLDKFRNGDPIPQAKTDKEWRLANAKKQAAWCYVSNNAAYGMKFGKLYNWYAINDPRGLAPKGWHVATDAEWSMLYDFAGFWRIGTDCSTDILKDMKSWKKCGAMSEICASVFTGECGSALRPGGWREKDGKFKDVKKAGYWWTSVKTNKNMASIVWIGCGYSRPPESIGMSVGASVRCVKDKPRPKSKNREASKKFKSVFIGKQKWMCQDLDEVVFQNGDSVPQAKTLEAWIEAAKNQQAAWCYFEFDSIHNKEYSKLYNWYTVNDPRGIAPAGWHVASDSDWRTLKDFLNNNKPLIKNLKSKTGWPENKQGNNETGFNALPGLLLGEDGKFFKSAGGAEWWTDTEYTSKNALSFYFNFDDDEIIRGEIGKQSGLPLRCVRD